MKKFLAISIACLVALLAAFTDTSSAARLIGEDRAIDAARAAIGAPAESVVVDSVALKDIRSIAAYEVRLTVAGSSQVVFVNAETAEIIDRAQKRSQAPAPAPQQNSYIGVERARDIACRHAGVSPDQIYKLEVEMDHEWGRTIYEVEFKHGRYEYDYHIDATTGEVLKAKREYD